jgi:hypothetical protein
MNEISTEDLHKAMAAFLICLGSTLPAELAQKISSRMVDLSQDMQSGGEPIVAKLTKDFAEAVVQIHNRPKH